MSQLEQKVQKTGERITQTVDNLVDTASSKAREMAQDVEERVESARDTLHNTVRYAGEEMSDAVNAVSKRVKSSANYVQEQGFSGLVGDAEVLIRRYPMQTLFVGVILGVLIGRSRSR